MCITKLSCLACKANLTWITLRFSPECCFIKCLCYAADLKESKPGNSCNRQCSFSIFGLASVVSAEPVTMGPYCILFFSGSRIILSRFQFCSHIKCTVVPCTGSFLAEDICVALYYLRGKEGDEKLQHL